jgi:CheY-like chemotaxis protein
MILFIDDERRRIQSFIDELELNDHKVKFESNVDDALDFFASNHNQLDLLILDVMMPTGNTFNDKEADNGFKTGICFYGKVRQQKPNIPIIIFTNVLNSESFDTTSGKTFVFEKDMMLPLDLVEKVNHILKKEH